MSIAKSINKNLDNKYQTKALYSIKVMTNKVAW